MEMLMERESRTLQEQGEWCSLPCSGTASSATETSPDWAQAVVWSDGVEHCLGGRGVYLNKGVTGLGVYLLWKKGVYLCSHIPWDTHSSGKQQGCQEQVGTQPGWLSESAGGRELLCCPYLWAVSRSRGVWGQQEWLHGDCHPGSGWVLLQRHCPGAETRLWLCWAWLRVLGWLLRSLGTQKVTEGQGLSLWQARCTWGCAAFLQYSELGCPAWCQGPQSHTDLRPQRPVHGHRQCWPQVCAA